MFIYYLYVYLSCHFMLHVPTYGLVICGGKSSRMGRDKSMIAYYTRPQCYHVYDMLRPLCSKVFINCNAMQVQQYAPGYNVMPDKPEYENIGPMAALLTAFSHYARVNFLAVGCDYPFIKPADLQGLMTIKMEENIATALYNESENLYEPLLAWYSAKAAEGLRAAFNIKKYSLQRFLWNNHAAKVFPAQQTSIISVDTEEAFTAIKKQLE
jgi:molybdopterin-guanine dinucleotide biosynthesis protein A